MRFETLAELNRMFGQMKKGSELRRLLFLVKVFLLFVGLQSLKAKETTAMQDSIRLRIDELVPLISNNPQEFISNAELIEKFCLDQGDTLSLHLVRMWKGVVFAMNGNLDQAIRIFFNVSEYAQSSKNPRLQLSSLNNIAGVFRHNGNYSKAEEYINKALSIWEKGDKDELDRGQLLLSLGMVLDVLDKMDEAEISIKQAIEIFKSNTEPILLIRSMGELGVIMEKKGEYAKAMSVYNSMIPLYTYNNDLRNVSYISQLLGGVSLKMGQYSQAYKQLTSSLHMADSLGYEVNRDSTLVKLIKVTGRLNKIDEMESYVNQLAAYHKKQEAQNIEEKIEDLESTHLLNEQKLENEVLRAESENQKLQLLNFRYLMIGSVAFLAILVVLFITVYRYNEKVRNYSQELKKANAELEKHIAAKTELLDNRNLQLIQASFALAHEIRAKVSTILGASELLKMEKEDSDSNQLIVAIKESTEELDVVVRDLISRLED